MVKMAILPKAIYGFNAILIKIPMMFSTELEKNNPKVYMGPQKTQNYQTILLDNYQTNVVLPRQYYIATVVKNSLVLAQKQTHTDQWNRIAGPEITPHTYGQLIYDKGGKNIKWRKDSLFSKWCWESSTATYKSRKLEHSLTPYTKINSNGLKP